MSSATWPRCALACVAAVLQLAFGEPAASDEPTWIRILPSAEVTLRDPRRLSVSVEGLLYVADTGHHRILALDSAGNVVAETGGMGTAHGQFRWPTDVVADRGNVVWVLDWGNRRIEKFTRLLVYQGTLEIPDRNGETAAQPEALAVSLQGDLFVFDRDGGRMIRYDPLFRPQAELGGGSGSQFISNVHAMTFVPRYGLCWWERGSEEIRRTDPLLNPISSLRLDGPADELSLATADTCLLYGSLSGLFRSCDLYHPAETLFEPFEGDSSVFTSVTSLSVGPDRRIYILDARQGSVYRLSAARE
ncbi:MAG: NHL repeat-containing protein [bacterium]|nr:NHL repeat-containing protein [bacterium]